MARFEFTKPVLMGNVIRFEWEAIDETNRVWQSGQIAADGEPVINIDDAGKQLLTLRVETIVEIDRVQYRSRACELQIPIRDRGKSDLLLEAPSPSNLREVV